MGKYDKVREFFEQQQERLKQLRNGEKVLCKKCKSDYMQPLGGDYRKTTTFMCPNCKNQIILN